MPFDCKSLIEDYCSTGNLSVEEVDFLEQEHLKTMSHISEKSSPSVANSRVCEVCHLEEGSLWIICNASILDKVRPVKTGKQRAHKLFDTLCKFNIYPKNF